MVGVVDVDVRVLSYSTAQFKLDYFTRVTTARLYTIFRLLDACMRVHERLMTYGHS